MPYYSIYISDGADRLQGGASGEFPDDKAAVAAARAMLRPGESAEISAGGRIILVKAVDPK